MPGSLRPSAGYVGRGVMDQSALEYMLYHQKSFAQVKPGRRRRAASHTFSPATRRLDCRQSQISERSRKYQPLRTIHFGEHRPRVGLALVLGRHATALQQREGPRQLGPRGTERAVEVPVDGAVEVDSPGPVAGQAIECLGEIVDVAAVASARLMQIARLVECGQAGAGGLVSRIAQLERAGDL